MKICVVTNVPAPYKVDFYNDWGRQCDLTVIFEGVSAKDREEAWHNKKIFNFQAIFLKDGFRVTNELFLKFDIFSKLNMSYDLIIFAGYASPTSQMAMKYCKTHGMKFGIEADGGILPVREKILKKWWKTRLISAASFWLSSGNMTTAFFEQYGARREHIYEYPFSSIYQSDIISTPLQLHEKSNLRETIGLRTNAFVILFVGQFIHRKGLDVLIQAAKLLGFDFQLCLIGRNPDKELQQQCEELDIFCPGFMPYDKLKYYYQAADVFVLPTRYDIWGLVVNEAMANGMPVITTDKCVAGIELIENGENGYIVPSDSPRQLAEQIERIYADPTLRYHMGLQNIIKIQNYTIEMMAKCHQQIASKELLMTKTSHT